MTAAIELDLLVAWLNRHGADPAPTAGEQPKPTTDQPIPSRPGPCVTVKACGCGVLDGEQCDCAEFNAQARTAARQPIFFDFRKAAA